MSKMPSNGAERRTPDREKVRGAPSVEPAGADGAAEQSVRTSVLLQIEWWPTNKPIPYARNPRKITPEAIDKVAASIKEFGWQQPIVVDTEGVIIIGHTRQLAAYKLELEMIPVHVASGLSVAQVQALRIADNRTGREARDDYELLAVELKDLQCGDYNLLLTGFDIHELEPLLAANWKPPTPSDDFDAHQRSSAGTKGMRAIMVSDEQHDLIASAIGTLRKRQRDSEISDGRALELICGEYLAGPDTPID